jgi:hypothetical protein
LLFRGVTRGSVVMRKSLKRILDRLRSGAGRRVGKQTSVRGDLQGQQRMQALGAATRTRRAR